MKTVASVLFTLALLTAGRPAFAQSSISNTDIQQLQDAIYEASRDVTQLRSHDTALANQLQGELDDARDGVAYLRVKLRRSEPIAQTEYTDLRGQVESIRSRARGDAQGRSTPPSGSNTPASRDERPAGTIGRPQGGANEIPVGTEFDVRTQASLSSKTTQVEDKFEATTLVDLKDADGKVVVPAGSVMRGIVSSVKPAGRVERKGSLTVAFDRITIRGRSYPIRATVTQAIESEGIRGEAGKIGIGAGAGAILGAILGGAKGALAGILIGGGGTIAATEGTDVDLPAGTILRVRMDSAINLR